MTLRCIFFPDFTSYKHNNNNNSNSNNNWQLRFVSASASVRPLTGAGDQDDAVAVDRQPGHGTS